MSELSEQINRMYDHELTLGGRAALQYGLLKDVRRKELAIGDFPSFLFFNPGRVHSVMADVSAKTLAERKCFLCPDGLETMQQTFTWNVGAGYYIRVNPFPIFHHHFTISSIQHEPQQIKGHYTDMLRLAEALPEYTIFYNGARCGASAPDHMHFQAVPMNSLPMQVYCDEKGHTPDFCPSAHLVKGESIEEMERQVMALIERYAHMDIRPTIEQALPPRPDDADFNMVSWWNGHYNTLIQFRRQSRPACFFAENPEERMLISPGAVEMSGVAIVSSEEAFERLTADWLHRIIREVSVE